MPVAFRGAGEPACLSTELLVAGSLVDAGVGHLGSPLLKRHCTIARIIMILIKLCLI